MSYCPNCGTYNEGNERAEDEPFGLPYGRTIVRMLIGSVIFVFGVAWTLSLTFNMSIDVGRFLPFLVIIFALLMIAGAIYELRHRS
jgi:hypothetical protein